MIVKPLEPPVRLLQALCLESRIQVNHFAYPKLLEIIRREKAGWIGEKQIDFFINRINSAHLTLHSLRLVHDRTPFQMDTIILTPHFFLLIEVKNIAGSLRFQNGQMVRQFDNKTDTFNDPIIQVEEQKIQLMYWLQSKNITIPPIETLVVFTHSKAHLDINPHATDHSSQMIPVSSLNKKIREISHMYNSPTNTIKELYDIAKMMTNTNQPLQIDLRKNLEILPKDIIKGVRCPQCGNLSMQFSRRRWECPKCRKRSKDAHINAFKDMFLIDDPYFTNKKTRTFLCLQSPHTLNNLIRNMNFNKKGKTNGRIYEMTYQLETDFDYLLYP